MNTHQFYNLLDGKISLPKLRDCIYKYPILFRLRYNYQVVKIKILTRVTMKALSTMGKLEKEQLSLIISQHANIRGERK